MIRDLKKIYLNKMLMRFIQSIAIISSIMFLHKLIDYKQETSLKQINLALDLIYSQFYDQENTINTYNSHKELSFNKDYQKLIHPDTVLEDFYVLRHQLRFPDPIIKKKNSDTFPFSKTIKNTELDIFSASRESNYYNLILSATKNYDQNLVGLLDHQIYYATQNESTYQFSKKKQIQQINLMNDRLDALTFGNCTKSCLEGAQYSQKTYNLNDLKQCLTFFSNYSQNQGYIAFNSNQKLQDYELKNLLNKYQNGSKVCQQKNKGDLYVQLYNKPILHTGSKFNLRIELMILEQNPMIMYMYKTFMIMKCIDSQTQESVESYSGSCSEQYTDQIITYMFYNNIKVSETFSIEQFNEFIVKEKLTKDKHYIKKTMIPEIEKKLTNYFESLSQQQTYPAIQGQFQTCEFDVDVNLNVWLLECTAKPMYTPPYSESELYFNNLNRDRLVILQIYQRQKFLRIQKLVKGIIEQYSGNLKQKLPWEELQSLRKFINQTLVNQIIQDKNISQSFHLIQYQKIQEKCQKYYQQGLLVKDQIIEEFKKNYLEDQARKIETQKQLELEIQIEKKKQAEIEKQKQAEIEQQNKAQKEKKSQKKKKSKKQNITENIEEQQKQNETIIVVEESQQKVILDTINNDKQEIVKNSTQEKMFDDIEKLLLEIDNLTKAQQVLEQQDINNIDYSDDNDDDADDDDALFQLEKLESQTPQNQKYQMKLRQKLRNRTLFKKFINKPINKINSNTTQKQTFNNEVQQEKIIQPKKKLSMIQFDKSHQ